MSNKQRFYPNSTAAQALWLRNFAAKLRRCTEGLEINPDEVTEAILDALWVAYIIGEWQPAARKFAVAATQYAKLVEDGAGSGALPVFIPPALPEGTVERPFGALARVFRFVQIIKHKRHYSEPIGVDLGLTITASQAQHDVPEIRVRVEEGPDGPRASIRYRKWGHTGIWIESRIAGGDWEHIATTNLTTCIDDRPLRTAGQPEIREYRARYWDEGKPNGDWSPVAHATLGV